MSILGKSKIPELELLKLKEILNEATDDLIEWRGKCGSGGWYEISKRDIRDFLKLYISKAYKVGVK